MSTTPQTKDAEAMALAVLMSGMSRIAATTFRRLIFQDETMMVRKVMMTPRQ